MLNAVSCRTIDCLLHVLSERGIDAARLVEHMPMSLEYLRDGSNWLLWAHYVALLQRYGELVGTNVADATARHFVNSSLGFDLARSFAGMFADVREFYWFNLKAVGTAFPFIEYTFEALDDELVRIVLTIPETLEDCPLFLEISGYVHRYLPTALGLEPAAVEINVRLRQATYLAQVPRRLALCYRAELRGHYADIRTRNPRYSLRAFARHIGVSAAMLSNVLAGKRNLSVEAAHQVAVRLGYSPDRTRRFCQVVQLGSVMNPALQSILGG